MQLWHWVPRNSIFSIFFTWRGALFVQSSRLRSPQTQDNTIHIIMGTGRIGSAGLPNSFIAPLSPPAPAHAPCLAWYSLAASPAPPTSIPQTPAPSNDVPPPKSSIGSGRGSHGAGGCCERGPSVCSYQSLVRFVINFIGSKLKLICLRRNKL